MKKLINLLFLSLFFIGWDMPDSYTSPNRSAFSGGGGNNNLRYIPVNSVLVQTASIGQIMNKMNYPKIINTDLMDYAFEEMRNNDVPRKIRGFIKDPYLMGIDLDQPIYTYLAPAEESESYHEKPTEVLIDLFEEFDKMNILKNSKNRKEMNYSECQELVNSLDNYVFISSFTKEKWIFNASCDYDYYDEYRYFINSITAESTASMEDGYGHMIELYPDYYDSGQYSLSGYGHSDYNNFNDIFNSGFVLSMKDLDLFENNVASMIDLIPDRNLNIKDGEINGFKYKLMQLRDRYWNDEREIYEYTDDLDVFIVAYNKDVILISFNVIEGMHNSPTKSLVSDIKNRTSNKFDVNKPGLDEIANFDTSLWMNVSLQNSSLKDIYLEILDEMMREIPDFDEDVFIEQQEKQLTKSIEISPYLIAGINVSKNDFSVSMKSFFGDIGKEYFKEISTVLDKKIGKEIIQSVPTNDMIAGMGYSVNLAEAIDFSVNYEKELFNTNHINDFLNQASSELKISVEQIKEMFSGNALALLYDIDFEQRMGDPVPELVFVFGLENSDNFIKTFNRISELEREFDDLLYKNELFTIDRRDGICLLIKDDFGYIGSRSVINGLIYNNSYQSKMSKIVNNKPENLNSFFTVNLNEAIALIPTDRDREAREIKSFLRGLGLGSLNLESTFNKDYSEVSGNIQINSGAKYPLEFIAFNLIPLIEDEILK